jgi:hypothetical protein
MMTASDFPEYTNTLEKIFFEGKINILKSSY